MRFCPFAGCGAMISPVLFACRRHWSHLNPAQQRTIHAAYADYKAAKIDIDQLRAIQQTVLDAVQGRRQPLHQ
jgi:hypothetical protein